MKPLLISPYHITSREPPAMVGLLLAERAVTILPAFGAGREGPAGGDERERFEAACRSVRRYRELMDAWRWSGPLWSEGALASTWGGMDAATEVRRAHRRVLQDERFAPLRGFMREQMFDDEWGFLGALTTDLLKGGADPAVSVPLTAGMDAFAARHGLACVRPEPVSLTQRSEARLARRLFAFVVPALLEGEGERLAEARQRLAPELDDLRAALAHAERDPDDPEPVRAAARIYTQAFETEREALTRIEDPADLRVVVGLVSVTGVALPADAALLSGASAARRVTAADARARSARAPSTPAHPPPPAALALPEPPPAGEAVSLIVKVVSR